MAASVTEKRKRITVNRLNPAAFDICCLLISENEIRRYIYKQNGKEMCDSSAEAYCTCEWMNQWMDGCMAHANIREWCCNASATGYTENQSSHSWVMNTIHICISHYHVNVSAISALSSDRQRPKKHILWKSVIFSLRLVLRLTQ